MQEPTDPKEFFKDINPFPGYNDFAKTFERLLTLSNDVNRSFTQGRLRIQELVTTLADVSPKVIRIGGSIEDVSTTMKEIAEASRRNIIGTDESIVKLSAAYRVLGISAKELVENFGRVGISTSLIGKELENSISYISSIGGNSKQVLKDVSLNLDLINRFQFEGGVQGLTKMAAQASMVKFDMKETVSFANKVLNPEDAINVASAFQRLGVAVGGLGDPFQLMNQSINDPSGLQNSLIEITKQFTYFDDKTKQFKISPEGVLRIREIEKEAGLTSGSLSKMATSAADLDRRLSKVDTTGLVFKNEEDKQLLANLIQMDKKGEYEIKLYDEKGQTQLKNLSQITQDEFNKLIDEQKKRPTTLEEISRSQLRFDELMSADIRAIKQTVTGAVVSTTAVPRELEGLRRVFDSYLGKVSKTETSTLRKDYFEPIGDKISKLVQVLGNPQATQTERLKAFEEFKTQAQDTFKDFQEKFKDIKDKIFTEAPKELTDKSALERLIKKISGVVESTGTDATNMGTSYAPTIGGRSIPSIIGGPMDLSPLVNPNQTNTPIPERDFVVETITTKHLDISNTFAKTSTDINVNGTIKHEIKLDAPAYISRDDLTRTLTKTFESGDWKNSVINIFQKMNPDPARSSTAV